MASSHCFPPNPLLRHLSPLFTLLSQDKPSCQDFFLSAFQHLALQLPKAKTTTESISMRENTQQKTQIKKNIDETLLYQRNKKRLTH
jgi:hypothetical protein